MEIYADIRLALKSYVDAIRLIRSHKLGSMFILSCLAYIILIVVSVYLLYKGLTFAYNHISPPTWFMSYKDWLNNHRWILNTLLTGIFISTISLFISFYKYIFIAIASPLFAYISEQAAEAINDTSYPFNFNQFVNDIIRGIFISFRNFSKQFFITILFFFLSFIPIVGFIFSFFIVVIDCYYYGFSMLDYNCEREKMNISTSQLFIKKHKGLAIGNGAIFYLSFIIPILGLMFVAPLSVIAASISFYKISENKLTNT